MPHRHFQPAKLRNLYDWACPRCDAVFTTHVAPSRLEWWCVACGHRDDVEKFCVAAGIRVEPAGLTHVELAPMDPTRTPSNRAAEHRCRHSDERFIVYEKPTYCPHCGEVA